MSTTVRKRIVVFGATGTIGKALVAAVVSKYLVLQVGKRQGDFKAELADVKSISILSGTPDCLGKTGKRWASV